MPNELPNMDNAPCEYPDTDMPLTGVTFRLSPSYDLTTAHKA